MSQRLPGRATHRLGLLVFNSLVLIVEVLYAPRALSRFATSSDKHDLKPLYGGLSISVSNSDTDHNRICLCFDLRHRRTSASFT